MPTYADLVSKDIMTESEKQILCGALAVGNAALSHWLIFRQGPRLIELAGSVVIAVTQGLAQVTSTALGQGGIAGTIAQEVNPFTNVSKIVPFAGSDGGTGGQALTSALPFLLK